MTVMKRYLLFAGSDYYPGGGWEDYIGTFHTIEEARQAAKDTNHSWWQIVDTTTLKIIQDDPDPPLSEESQ